MAPPLIPSTRDAMLHALPEPQGAAAPDLGTAHWLDLDRPDAAELARAAPVLSAPIPTQAELSEIEATSRLRLSGDCLCMSLPVTVGSPEHPEATVPTGFLLTERACITVHYAAVPAFEALRREWNEHHRTDRPEAAFLDLIERLVDHAADQLEHCGDALHRTSADIFQPAPQARLRLSLETGRLRSNMIRLGRVSDQASKVRYELACLGRMCQFVRERAGKRFPGALGERLIAIDSDLDSLSRYEDDLSNRTQFLLDAATSMVSIEQNEVMKVLTVASVAGVPPVLIAGIYGMNFHRMPELGWHLGYPLALGLIALSTAWPLLWFRRRGWI
jgi:magnesium transporter